MNALRLLPVDWRIFLIVVLNGAVLLVLAALTVSGAHVIMGQWSDVRQGHADDRIYSGIQSELGQLQGLVHRYLHAPSGDLLAELDSRRARLLREMEGFRSADPAINAEFAQMAGASRRFLASFDAVRESTSRLRRAYDAVVLHRAPEMTGLLAGLTADARQDIRDAAPWLGQARDALADGLSGFSAFYLTGDSAAAERAATNLELLRRALAALRDAVAAYPRQAALVDALSVRAGELQQALEMMRRELQRQTRIVVEEIDGRQKAMAETISRLIDGAHQRVATAEQAFSDTVTRLGWQLALVCAGFLTISAAASWLIGQSVARPLRSLREAMAAAADGDFDRIPPDNGHRDEIADMARVLTVFRENARAKRRMEKERDAQERRWRMMLESSPVGVSIIRARDLARVYTNPKYDELFGLSPDDSAQSWPLAESFADPQDVQQLVATFTDEGHLSNWEVRRRRRDGGEWWCQLDIRSVDYRGERSYMVWHYDVTERLLSAQELRAARDRAEQALETLHDAQESLVQAEKMAALGSLVAGVAHEINTPVGITVTAASHLVDETEIITRRMRENALRRSDFERFMALSAEAASRILSNAQRAAALIHSFKQVAVDQTHDDRRWFNLGAYLHEVATSLGPRLKPGGHAIAIDCPPDIEIEGMPGALAQVLTNLVVNSVVHGFAGTGPGHILVAITCRDGAGGEEIRLVYSDDGIGIPADVLPRIFDPFFTTNRAGGGSGLGLNIVYNIVQQKMQGRISAESPMRQGARFTIIFPRAPSPSLAGGG